MSTGRHGLVIGKFYPPHAGHHAHIREAAGLVDRLTVVVMASAAETVALADRVAWLREVHAPETNVTVVGIPCDAPMDLRSEAVWSAQVALMRAAAATVTEVPVDVVLTSEEYGDELARRFGARHVLVDPQRRQGTSGTAVRADLPGHWDRLHPVVRRGLTTRVVVVGAESTGTTTVTRALAEHYAARGGVWGRTSWVPEYGREFTYAKLAEAVAAATAAGAPRPGMTDLVWTAEDFRVIAQTQTRMEDAAAESGSPLLLCDTDAFATSVWEYRYAGPGSHGADDAARDLPPRSVYLLTDHVGVPFEDDGWRDGEHIRADMTRWFVERLTAAGHSWVLLTGTLEERLELGVRTVDHVLARTTRFGDPLDHVPTVLEVS